MATSEPTGGRRMTIEEFERLPESDEFLYELDHGLLVREPRPGAAHGAVSVNFAFALRRHADAHGGSVVTESGFILSEAEHTLRGPDVAWIQPGRLDYGLPDGFIRGAPDLAVEVLSPSDSVRTVRNKIRQYLEAGTSEVWIARPRDRLVEVHRADAEPRVLNADDVLDGGALLPGFREGVGELFRG